MTNYIKYSFPIVLFFSILMSCEMKKVELDGELKDELDMAKPVIIGLAEVSAVAQEIGDSILKDIKINGDTSFSYGRNKVQVIGEKSEVLNDSKIKDLFESFAYGVEADKSLLGKSVVDYKKTYQTAHYQNFVSSESGYKLILIDIDLSEVNLRVVRKRKK